MIAEWAGNSGLSWMCPGLPVSKLPNMFAFPYWHLRLNLSQSELSLLPPLLYVLVAFQASPRFLESAPTPVAPTWQSSPSTPSPLPLPPVPALTWPVTAPSCEPPRLPGLRQGILYTVALLSSFGCNTRNVAFQKSGQRKSSRTPCSKLSLVSN